MGFDTTIQKEIKKRANKLRTSLSEDSLYLASSTVKLLSSLAGTLVGDHTNPIEVIIHAGGSKGFTAYTDGERINLNYEHSYVKRYSTEESRFDAFMGMFFHEMSHVLYCDFAAVEKAIRTISSGILFGAAETKTEEQQHSLDEIYSYLCDERTRSIFVNIYNELDNVIADRHDEDEMMYYHANLTESGIMKIRESLQTASPPYEEYIKLLQEGKTNKLAVVFACILQYSRFGSIFIYDEQLWSTDPVLALVKDCAPIVDDAVSVDDPVVKFGYLNKLVIQLWPVIKEEIDSIKEKAENNSFNSLLESMGISDSTSGSGGSYMDDATAQQVVNAINDALNKAKADVASNPSPKNEPTRVTQSYNRSDKPKDGNSSYSGSQKNNSSDLLEQVAGLAAQEAAQQEMDSKLANTAVDKVNAVNMNSSHKDIPLNTTRHLQMNEQRCAEITKKTHPYTKRLILEIENTLKDLQQGSINKHRQYGRIFVPGDAYRPDGKFFANNKLPRDLPDMAIAILVDNSGSMNGQRISAAREAALLIYDFATAIGVPVSVYGHTFTRKMEFIIFSDFERAGKMDRPRIADMEALSCNHDGMAIEIAANLLNGRSEKYKLLIIISDGQPNAPNYGGAMAAKDIQSIIKRYRSKNIEFLAAAIGDDKPMIKEIYGDSYIDISDLSRMPKQMARLVYSRLIKHIYI